MSQVEMESLLLYEQNLAACYEAEYLLELSMQREHLSDDAERSGWAGYDDGSEARSSVHPHPAPSSPSPLPEALQHTHSPTEERMDCDATSNGHHVSTTHHSEPTPVISSLNSISSSQAPSSVSRPLISALANTAYSSIASDSHPHVTAPVLHLHSTFPSCLTPSTPLSFTPAQLPTSSSFSSTFPSWSDCITPTYSRGDGSHTDGPLRKKIRLYRPEF